jgi:hypothetical protein
LKKKKREKMGEMVRERVDGGKRVLEQIYMQFAPFIASTIRKK